MSRFVQTRFAATFQILCLSFGCLINAPADQTKPIPAREALGMFRVPASNRQSKSPLSPVLGGKGRVRGLRNPFGAGARSTMYPKRARAKFYR